MVTAFFTSTGVAQSPGVVCFQLPLEGMAKREAKKVDLHSYRNRKSVQPNRAIAARVFPVDGAAESRQSTMPLLVAFSAHPLKPFRASAIAALTASWITRKNLERDAWFEAVQEHHFVACPIGHGYDTHRTWEVLLSGSIPIVESTSMDSMYENLPVLIVHRWSEVTQDLLKNVSHDFRLRDDLNLEKLFFGYWRDLIMAAVTKG